MLTLRGAAAVYLSLIAPGASANLFQSGDSQIAKGNRIVNGDKAADDRYPYMVSMQDGGGHFCGGTLIARQWVLTAAHCLGGDMRVVIGDNSVNTGEKIDVESQLRHPGYKDSTNEYDLALLKLEEPVSLNIQPIKLNMDMAYPDPDTMVTTMGWGETSAQTRGLSSDLLETNVEVLDNQECEELERSGKSYNDFGEKITDDMVCTFTQGTDACYGDSGGPLIVPGETPEEDEQIGVVSWGIGCAYLPGVFARVAYGHDWIKETVCDDGGSDGPLCGEPTQSPTRYPTKSPTKHPSSRPSASPSVSPSARPSSSPSFEPTASPTTSAPTLTPTDSPSGMPSLSSKPTSSPSESPSLSSRPSLRPTGSPSISSSPSGSPSGSPSISSQPSLRPSISTIPTIKPSSSPSVSISPTISFAPTASPTSSPSEEPSSQPSSLPSSTPSVSVQPSSAPSPSPSASPTLSSAPTVSRHPTLKPTQERVELVWAGSLESSVTGDALLNPNVAALAGERGGEVESDESMAEASNTSGRTSSSFALGAMIVSISLWMGL